VFVGRLPKHCGRGSEHVETKSCTEPLSGDTVNVVVATGPDASAKWR
jgi:hypothetical protein